MPMSKSWRVSPPSRSSMASPTCCTPASCWPTCSPSRRSSGSIDGRVVAWIGDGNNMANSWIEAAGLFGFELRLACPAGYQPDAAILAANRDRATITVTESPLEAARGADVINTDVWASMGQEEETAVRQKAFAGYSCRRCVARERRIGCHRAALPPRTPRRRDFRGGARRPALTRVGRSGEPVARAEGTDGDVDGGAESSGRGSRVESREQCVTVLTTHDSRLMTRATHDS